MATQLTENGKIILEGSFTSIAKNMTLFGNQTRGVNGGASAANENILTVNTESIAWTTPSITTTGVDITNLTTFFLPCTTVNDVPSGENYYTEKEVEGISILGSDNAVLLQYTLGTPVSYTAANDKEYGKYSVSSFQVQFIL